MNKCAVAAAVLLVAVAMRSPAHAQSIEQAIRAEIHLSSDLSVDAIYHYEMTPRVEAAIRTVAQMRWQVPGNQKMEVVEAFTRKADGRVVPADPKDFSTQSGIVGDASSFVDLAIQQVPFRDVSVGDTTVLTLRMTEKQHYIPGQFWQEWVITPGAVRQTLDVTLRSPASLEIYSDAQQLAYQETREGDDVVRHWSSGPPQMRPAETSMPNLALWVPSVRFSTIPSYAAIGRAYFEGARDKTTVTPETQRLADEITRDKQDVRSQALALYEWVSKQIRYVAVVLGNGRYVPNDTETILSRRFGDCKDHAALLVALLAAKGIVGEQALINLGPMYQLAKTATLSFNHVIVYIPVLNLYLDPTAEIGSFGHLPTQDLDKPVVRATAKGGILARTPNLSIDDNVLELDTRIIVTEDGHQQGQTSVAARGEFSDMLRGYVAQAQTKGVEAALQTLATQRGLGGEFGLTTVPSTPTSDLFRVVTKWDDKRSLDLAQDGWRVPPGFSPFVPYPDLFFGPLDRGKRIYPAGCRAGRAVHSVDVTLPSGIIPDRLPETIQATARDFAYREQWSVVGNHLHVRTETTSSCQGRVISPAQMDAVRAAFARIQDKVSPLLHFSRADGRVGANRNLAANPAEKTGP